MSNEEMVIEIQNGNKALLENLWKQNLGFIRSVARKYTGFAELDDLMQEGYLGLCSAAERWKQTEGANFLSYARYWIQQRMARYIEKNSVLSRERLDSVKKLQGTQAKFEQEFGRQPTRAEICDLLDLTEKELDQIERAAYLDNCASLDSPVNTDDGEASLGDLIPSVEDPEESVLDKVRQEELSEVMCKALDSLPDNVSEVLHEKYWEGKSSRQIGAETGKTQNQISGIEYKGISELKRSRWKRQLEQFADDFIIQRVYRGNGSEAFNRTWTSQTERIALDLMDTKTYKKLQNPPG